MRKQFIFIILLVCVLLQANAAVPDGPADVITGAVDTAASTAGGSISGLPGGQPISAAVGTVADKAKGVIQTVGDLAGGGASGAGGLPAGLGH